MNADEIKHHIDRTTVRLRLNYGAQACYDDLGCRELLEAFHNANAIGDQHGIAHSLMFLGRLLEIKHRYSEARLLYLKSKTMFADQKDMFWIPAKEYLSECPVGGFMAKVLYENRRDAVVTGAVSAEQLVGEFFTKHIKETVEGKKSHWRGVFHSLFRRNED